MNARMFIKWAMGVIITLFAVNAAADQATSAPTTTTTASASTWRVGEAMSAGREVVDMIGRRVVVPAKIERVYGVNPIATVFLYTLAPSRMMAWNYPLSAEAKKYIGRTCRDLPALGAAMGRSSGANAEEILRRKPDMVLVAEELGEWTKTAANRVEKQWGVPVVVIDSRLAKTADAYRFIGTVLGVADRGTTLATYCEKTLSEVAAITATVPTNERVRFYYAQGVDGLETDRLDAAHGGLGELAGGINVAANGGGRVVRSRVSMEEVIVWQPAMVFVGYGQGHQTGLADRLKTDNRWKTLPAGQTGAVYEVPTVPFGWCDRPPGPNRFIGLRWMAWRMYPTKVTWNMRDEVRRFYALFYHIKSDELLNVDY